MARRVAALVGTFVATIGFTACGGSQTQEGPQAIAAETDEGEPQNQDEFAEAHGLELKKFDLNRDKTPDVFKFYRLVDDPRNADEQIEMIVRKEIDINHDGKIDVVRVYDGDEEVTEEHTDLDFDGLVDEVAFYKQGLLVRKEIDLNYDGAADIKRYYSKKGIQRIEADRDGDGKIDTWEYYEGGAIDRIGTDLDGDGEVDNWEQMREPDVEEVEEPAEDETVEQPGGEGEEGEGEAGADAGEAGG